MRSIFFAILLLFTWPALADHAMMRTNQCVFISADSVPLQIELENALSIYFFCLAREAKAADVSIEVNHKLVRNPTGGFYLHLNGHVLEKGEIVGGWEKNSKTLHQSGIGLTERDTLSVDVLIESIDGMLNALFGHHFTKHLDPPTPR